jgi:transcription elongation factor GreB
MSKAFTSEETADEQPIVAPRAPLPDGVPNYVSARGLALLRDELAALRAQNGEPSVIAQRRAELEERIATAVVVSAPAEPSDVVHFGACVSVLGENGARRYRIVGVDEADPAHGRIAFVSPLARALLGRSVGDMVGLRAPRGDESLEITAVDYDADPD